MLSSKKTTVAYGKSLLRLNVIYVKSVVKSGEREPWQRGVQMSCHHHQGPGLCEYWRKGEHEEDNGNVSSSWSNGQ